MRGRSLGPDVSGWRDTRQHAAVSRRPPKVANEPEAGFDYHVSLKERPVSRISPKDLESLLATLDVSFVGLSECLVSRGYSLELGGVDAPGIHYNIVGTGRAVIGDREPVPLMPHTLIVVP